MLSKIKKSRHSRTPHHCGAYELPSGRRLYRSWGRRCQYSKLYRLVYIISILFHSLYAHYIPTLHRCQEFFSKKSTYPPLFFVFLVHIGAKFTDLGFSGKICIRDKSPPSPYFRRILKEASAEIDSTKALLSWHYTDLTCLTALARRSLINHGRYAIANKTVTIAPIRRILTRILEGSILTIEEASSVAAINR